MSGVCSCGFLLDCSAREGVVEIAEALRGKQEWVRGCWEDALRSAGQEPALVWRLEEVVPLLEALAVGDAPMIATASLTGARRWVEGGVPLHQAMAASQLFGTALAQAIRVVDRAPPITAAHALDRLGWLLASLIGVAYGADPRRSPGDQPVPMPEAARSQFCGLIGASQVMRRLYGRIEQAARGRETILVTGESGVGKELVARAIHQAAGDPGDRFVAVNCAALPRDLLESELFGHRRGAFSGAGEHHLGLIRAAEGGTLFLDEISEMAPEAQAKLLRVIQERTIRGVGEVREVPVQVRIVAASNRDLQEALNNGLLRRDLYYRLQRMLIDVPPLRVRISDVPLLVSTFVERWRTTYRDAHAKTFTPGAIERLCAHEWPGNVRELENTVFAACLESTGPLIRAEDLPELGVGVPSPRSEGTDISMREAERRAIAAALERSIGNKSLAARILGISRKQLYAKIERYGL